MHASNMMNLVIMIGLVQAVFGIQALPSNAQVVRNRLVLDVNYIKNNAEVVVVGQLIAAPMSLHQKIDGNMLYEIVQHSFVKGKVSTNSVIAIMTRISSSDGAPARVEERKEYMFFLEKGDMGASEYYDDLVVYRLVGNWQGIVALDKTARERRAVISIEKQFGVKIDDMPEAFVEAIKASFLEHDAVAGETNSPVELSDEATAIFDALKLQIHQKKLDPSQTNNGGQTRSTP
jgi:hypothetical protein